MMILLHASTASRRVARTWEACHCRSRASAGIQTSGPLELVFRQDDCRTILAVPLRRISKFLHGMEQSWSKVHPGRDSSHRYINKAGTPMKTNSDEMML